ncbi:hypothetical protein B0H11DRAFT_2188170 [Mycena galericulata]|nr:hypothetical protein B0H11DRAFT_2188170 [Mycena galericulata]
MCPAEHPGSVCPEPALLAGVWGGNPSLRSVSRYTPHIPAEGLASAIRDGPTLRRAQDLGGNELYDEKLYPTHSDKNIVEKNLDIDRSIKVERCTQRKDENLMRPSKGEMQSGGAYCHGTREARFAAVMALPRFRWRSVEDKLNIGPRDGIQVCGRSTLGKSLRERPKPECKRKDSTDPMLPKVTPACYDNANYPTASREFQYAAVMALLLVGIAIGRETIVQRAAHTRVLSDKIGMDRTFGTAAGPPRPSARTRFRAFTPCVFYHLSTRVPAHDRELRHQRYASQKLATWTLLFQHNADVPSL